MSVISALNYLLAAGVPDHTNFGFSEQEFFLVIQTEFMSETFLRDVLLWNYESKRLCDEDVIEESA